jgi:chromosome segregation ATPase
VNALVETTGLSDIGQAESLYTAAHAEADTERAKVANASKAVDDARSALGEASQAFKARPTVTNGTARMVAEQVLENAQEALAAATAAAKPALQAEAQAASRVAYERLLPELEAYPAHVQETVDSIVSLEAALRKLVTELEQSNRAYVERLREANAAAGAIGAPEVPMRVVGLDVARQRVRQALTQKYGHSAVIGGDIKSLDGWLGIWVG